MHLSEGFHSEVLAAQLALLSGSAGFLFLASGAHVPPTTGSVALVFASAALAGARKFSKKDLASPQLFGHRFLKPCRRRLPAQSFTRHHPLSRICNVIFSNSTPDLVGGEQF